MFEERYKRVTDSIHADDDLIERTLEAAEQPRIRTRPKYTGLRLALGTICAFVLVVIASARIMPPPKDIVTSNVETPGNSEQFLPLPSKLPSDDLTLSVSNVTLVNDSELSLILTVSGDKVDPLTYIDLDYPFFQDLYGSGWGHIDHDEDRQPHENRYRFTIESKDHPILESLGPTLELTVYGYTSGTTQTEIVHEIDWSSMDFPLSETGEPMIDLGSGLAITGLGFTEEGWLTVQSRWPYDSHDITNVHTWLSPDGANDPSTCLYMRGGKQYVAGDHIYNNQTFHVTRDELDSICLVTCVTLPGEVIEGNWPITVDLSHLTTE